MTSTETTTTRSSTVATSGLCANIDDIKDENVLREMWQEIEDGDAKRQIRSRMYKLREERLKEFYGREGQGFLDNILSSTDDSALASTVTMEGTQHRTVTTTECHTVDGTVVQSKTVQAKQTVNKVLESDGDNVVITTTTTRTTGGGAAGEEETNVTTARINNRDRTSQLQQIKNQQQRQSGRASSSSSTQKESASTNKFLSKKSSVDSDITSANRTSSNKSKNNNGMTNGVVSKRKQTTTTTTSTSGGASGGGKGTVTTAVTAAQAPTTPASEPQAIAIPIRREDVAGENREIVATDVGNSRSVASLARNFEQAEFSTMTMSQMSSQSVVVTSSSSSSSKAVKENHNTVMITPGEGATRISSQTTRTVVTSSGSGGGGIMHVDDQNNSLRGNEKLEIGKVVIKEVDGNNAMTSGTVSAGNEYLATITTTAQATSSSSQNRNSPTAHTHRSPLRSGSPTGNRVGDRWVNSLRSDASTLMNGDGTTDNKKSARRSASTSRTTSTTGKSTQNETIDRMSSSVSTKSTRSSSTSKRTTAATPTTGSNVPRSRSPSAPTGKNEEQTVPTQEKVCRRSNKLSTTESTQKTRTSRRQAATQDGKSPSPASTPRKKASSSSPQGKATRSPSKSRAPASNQPTGQQDRPSKDSLNQKALPKDGSDKATKSTEEKIMRELDILDTYLSQRSASIDEGNRDESSAMAKINGSLGEEGKVKKSDKNFSLGKASKNSGASITTTTTTSIVETDVMESGAEPPFTRTTYKYTCPDENHHPHSHKPNRSIDHSPDKSPERNVDERKRSPEKNRPGVRSVDKNDIEDQIVASSETSTTATISSGRKTDRPRSTTTSPRSPSSSPTKADNKSGKTKRPSSLSPEKKKKNNVASSNKTDEVKETPVISRKAHITQEESPGKKSASSPSKSAPLSSQMKKDLAESTTKTNELISKGQMTQQDRKSTFTQRGMTKEEKYEADILSRPSVFTARKATSVRSSTTTTTGSTTHSKPEPNPRTRKSSDSSPERDGPVNRVTVVREHLKPQEKHEVQPDDELDKDEESPLNPPKKFNASGLESPGAVLKAKSLFENKAQEAAKDRSSIELGSRVTTSPKLTVSKKAALFEARSRGERVSVSSGSTQSLNEVNDDKQNSVADSKTASLQEQRYTTCRIPEANERAVSMERRVSVVTVIKSEGKILQSETAGAEATDEVVEEEVNTTTTKTGVKGNEKTGRAPRSQPVRQDSGKITRTSISGETPTKSPSSSSTTPTKAEPRNKSPSRQQKPEKNNSESGGATPRKSSSTPRTQSPERLPQQKLNLRQTEQQSQVEKETNNIATSGLRTTILQKKDVVVVEENNNNKRNSIVMDSEEKVPMKKRGSKPKIDKQSEKLPDNFDQSKRRDSRGITGTMASSKIIENRKILQDIEQTNLGNRQEKLVDGAESKEILTSTNQTALSELKSANVVRQSMRQAQESGLLAASSTVITEEKSAISSSSAHPVGKVDEKTPAGTEPISTPTRNISKKSDSFTKNVKSKSPDRAESPGKVLPVAGETTTANSSTVVERRRSSNVIEKKVEAIMASFKQTSSSSITVTSSTRMTTAELNAIEEMENIEELEALLDKATDYDERSKIRARIRFLKRKATLVKRTSELGSPERQLTEDDKQKPLQNTYAAPSKPTPSDSIERRPPKEKKITSRKPSNELLQDKKVTSRKSSDELMKKSTRKSSMDKENVIVETTSKFSRGQSPQKSDRQSPSRSRPTEDTPQPSNRDTSSPRRSMETNVTSTSRTVGSRSNSGKIVINTTNKIEKDRSTLKSENEDVKQSVTSEEKTSDKTDEKQRKVSSETTELLSTRSYSRDQIRVSKKREDETIISESQAIQDQNLYSSRRSSKNLEDEKSEVEEARRIIRKSDSPHRAVKQETEKIEDTIVQDKRSGQETPKSSKPSSRATSPQRSEIPISARMKRERSLSPPKIPLKEPEAPASVPLESTPTSNVEKVGTSIGSAATMEKPIKQPLDAATELQEQHAEKKDASTDKSKPTISSGISTSVASSVSRKISSRMQSTDTPVEEKPDKSESNQAKVQRSMTKEEKYEADILSRPSVFTARKAVAAKELSPGPKLDSIPMKQKSPSPEREIRATPSRSSPQRSTTASISSSTLKDASPRSSVARGDSSRSLTSSNTMQSSSTATTTELAVKSEESTMEELSTTTTKSSRANQYTRRESSKELKSKIGDSTGIKRESSQPKDVVVTSIPSSDQQLKDQPASFQSSSLKPVSSSEPTDTSTEKSSDTTDKNESTRSSSSKSESVNKDEHKIITTTVSSRSSPSRVGTATTTTTTTRRTTPTSKTVQKATTTSTKGKSGERINSTEIVTSSYGIGPVDDDGTPLFGLRALRKIKQVQQEQEANEASEEAVTDDNEDQKVSSSSLTSNTAQEESVVSRTSSTSYTTSLRSNDMYGLRALRKQAEESNKESPENEMSQSKPASLASPRSSSVEKDRTTSTQSMVRTSLKENGISFPEKSNKTEIEEVVMVEEEEDDEDEEIRRAGETETCFAGVATTTATETFSTSSSSALTSNDSRKVSSPKSILKKTSSFSSTSSPPRKNSGDRGSSREDQSSPVVGSEEPIPESKSEKKNDNEISTSRSSTTTRKDSNSGVVTTTTVTTTEKRKTSGGKMTSMDDESWRRQRSHSPSPKLVASSSTASSIATFSRGKVGRSSVREMSKRFENDEEVSKSNSSTSLSSDMRASSLSRESSPSLMSRGSRAESPSRIPLSIKSTTVVSTSIPSGGNQVERDSSSIRTTSSGTTAVSSQMETFETGGVAPGGGEVSIQGSRQQKCQQRHFETATGTISVTSNVVQTRVVTSSRGTTTSSRSFLNDQSPIQNLEDVIDRMRGEDPELMKPFNSEQGDETVIIQSNNQGRNLLNKFIGAQVIMQAVEPLLMSHKVSMSVSSSLEQSGGMDSDMESPTIREVIENCESESEQVKQSSVHTRGGNSSVEITEISSSSSPHLIHQSSTVSESADLLTGGSTTAAEESSKPSADVSGELMPLILGQLQSSLDSICTASAGVIGAGASAISSSFHNSSYGVGNNHNHPLSSSSSYDIPYSRNDKNYGLNVNSNNKSSDHTTTSSSASSYAHHNNGNGIINISSPSGGGSESSIVCRSEEDQREEAVVDEESSTSSSSSEEECLFDSGTESGEDLSTNANVVDDDVDTAAAAAVASLENTESSAAAIGPSITLSSSATNANAPLVPVVLQTSSSASVVDSQGTSKYDDGATSSSELSCFIEGLKNSLKRNTNKESLLRSYYNNNSSDCGGGVPATASSEPHDRDQSAGRIPIDCGISNLQKKYLESSSDVCANQSKSNIDALLELQLNTPSISSSVGCDEQQRLLKKEEDCASDAGLIQQVDKVLTLLRDSLLKDPNCVGKISGNPDINAGISACSDPSKGKELIALIDRLKSSLSSQEDQRYDKENSFVLNRYPAASSSNFENLKGKGIAVNTVSDQGLPSCSGAVVKSDLNSPAKMIGCVPQALPPDLTRSQSNPWVGDFLSSSSSSNEQTLNSTPSSAAPSTEHINGDNNNSSGSNMTMNMSGSSLHNPSIGTLDSQQQNASGGGVPWKIRLAKRRSQPRSHTIGVTEEELAQARRLFEESTGFRFNSNEQQRQQQQQQQQQYNSNSNNVHHAGQQQQYSIYSNMQDLSSLGNLESVTNNNNLNNINNYSMSDARAVGKVPTSDIFTSLDNLPLSPTSSVPFPHDSLQMSGNGGKDSQQEELLPSSDSGSGCVSTTTSSTTPTNWQTDVEKRLTSIPRPFVKHATQFYEGYQPPPERRMTYASIDDSCPIAGGVIGNLKIKPFRTYSLDNNKTSSGASYYNSTSSSSYDDPSKSLFTPQETVQIAIHQAAIKKQMSEEEDRRKRRNSLTSYQNYESGVKPERNFALGMPKPYSPPKKQQQLQSGTAIQQQNGYSSLYQSADSGYTEESGTESHAKDDHSSATTTTGGSIPATTTTVSSQVNDIIPSSTTMSSAGNNVVNINGSSAQNCVTTSGNTVTYTASPASGFMHQQQQQQSPKRIENVQISLKELSSSEFPQLQIAITLNTNNSSSSDNNNSSGSGHINVTASSDGGQTTFARMPTNVTTTTSGASVTTNLQLGGNNAAGTAIISSVAGGNTNTGNPRQTDMTGSGSTQYFSNDEGQQTSTSMSRAIRYKSKNERKKRMKRANTIDIPHPPGLILHNNDDDDTGMDDEEDSDNNTYRLGRSVGGNGGSGGVPAYGHQFNKHQPFLPKTEGDKKFLAFLEKNNALGESRPLRPSYLGVNDRQWTSRFSNLKTSFESSSQGSSPSASPIPSPMRQPRSVSEMALSQERRSMSTGGETFSKPVWANTDKSQLPPQVRNKLHVFENKASDGAGEQLPHWKSPPPSAQSFHQSQQTASPYGRVMMVPGMKQTVSTNALNQMRSGQPSSRMMQRPAYSSHDNMALVGQKKNVFQGNSFDSKQQQFQQQQTNTNNNVKKPMPVRLQQHSLQDLPTTDHSQSLRAAQQRFSNQNGKPTSDAGVHMVHATSMAMEAMKKSAFVPTSSAVVPAHANQIQSLPHLPTSKTGVSHDDKVDLPWAKRACEPAPSSSAPTRDHNSGRILVSKARFEQPQLPTQAPQEMPSNLPHQGSITLPLSQPHPPLQQQSYSLPVPKSSVDSSVKYQTDVPPSSVYNKPHVSPAHPPQSTSTVQQLQEQKLAQQPMGSSAEDFVPVSRPNLKTFGVTQSFDEAFKRKLDQQVASGSLMHPERNQNVPPTSALIQQENQYTSGSSMDLHQQQNHGSSTGSLPTLSDNNNASTKRQFEQSSGSAFARQIPAAVIPPSSNVSTEKVSEVTPAPGQEGMIFTPVVSRVMRGPQQQRATTTTNRMSTLNDDEQNTRLTGARSNLRNFLNFHQQSAPSMTATENLSKRETNTAVPTKPKQQTTSDLKTLNVPQQLVKSLSGDAISTTQVSTSSSPLPMSNVESQEIRQSQENVRLAKVVPNVEQEQRPAIIPRQKSLSEFPKISSAPKIVPLTIETDAFNLAKPQEQTKNSNVPQNKTYVQTQQHPQHHSRHQQQTVQQQRTNANAVQVQQQFHLSQQHQQQLQQHQNKMQILQQQHHQATSKTTRSYPDTLHRTSSGSSIFSRAKNLFFGNQDGAPPSTKLRPKLPSASQPKITFPKQFEAQMSPESADRKQRELAAYFKQQHQELLQQQQQLQKQDSALRGVESKAIKIADAVSKSETSGSTSISVECEQSEMQASASIISSVNSSSSATTKIQSVSSTTTTSSSASISMKSVSKTGVPALPTTPMNKFKAMDQQANPGKKTGAPLFKFTNEGLKASATSAKDILLYWCQCRTREYENVKIENFSSSWSDGLAFCALIHHFYPDAFDYNSLNPRNRKHNFDLAFRIADEKAGIYPLLDTEDMVAMGTRPDWKCVFTYVQSMYQKLKDL